MVEFKDLPPELIEQVFLHLTDTKDILSVSETCKDFNEIVKNCDGITRKLSLYLNYPKDLTAFAAVLRTTKRRYRRLTITRTRDKTSDKVISEVENAFAPIGSTLRVLKLNWHPHRNIELNNEFSALQRPRREAFLFFRRHEDNPPIENRLREHLLRVFPAAPAAPPRPPALEAAHRDDGNDDVNRLANALDPLQRNSRNEVRDELCKEFIAVVEQFKLLERMEWKSVHIERKASAEDIGSLDFAQLRELKLNGCDSYCFDLLSSCQSNLTRLQIWNPFWGNMLNSGIQSFESFLVKQEALKTLDMANIQYPRLFQNDASADIQFKLDHLVLDNVFFKDKKIAEKFFKTQTELKSIDFQIRNEKLRNLDEMMWYNKIIKTVIAQNPRLTTVKVEKLKYKIENCDFLAATTNANVQELCFNVTGEEKNAEFFKQLLRSFPNLRRIHYKSEESTNSDGDICFDRGTVLEKLQALSIVNCSVHSLINICAENLQSFEYSPKLNGQFIDDYIGGFFHTHRGIKHLVIGSETGRSYFFVSYILVELIVNFLHQLESITVYNFAEVNKSVKLLCTLRSLKSLTLSSLQYQQFTAKTKVECGRMKLKLIPITICCRDEQSEYQSTAAATQFE